MYNVMLISPTKVKQYATLGLNVDDNTMGECIRAAQLQLRDVLGRQLLERLKELVYNKIQRNDDTIDDEENIAYKTLLNEYVVPALAWGTAVEAAQMNELKIRNMGTVKNSDTNVNAVGQGEYLHLASYKKTYLNDAYNRLTEFLCEEKAAFVELPDGYCTCSDQPLYANTNLWLGPSKR